MKTRQTKKVLVSFRPAIFLCIILPFYTACLKEKTVPNHSAIIYTDVNPDSVLANQELKRGSYKLDLNNDGIVDFEFDRSDTIACNDYWSGALGHATILSLKPTGSGSAIMASGTNLALALDSIMAISANSPWTTTPQELLYGTTSASGHCLVLARGYWMTVTDKYAGLKFIKDNQAYYGWARLSCSYHRALPPARPLLLPGQLILKDYAFNSIPNQPIRAGQTK
jgi:hypothetical protein